MKFIHVADLHFDSKINGFPKEKSKALKESVFLAFEQVLEYADKNDVKAIIIAGDMFDNDSVLSKSKSRIINDICKYPNIDFICLSGNHDENSSFFISDIEVNNLKIIKEDWAYFYYDNVCIAGVNKTKDNSRIIYNSLSLTKDKLNICVMHGQISSSNLTIDQDFISLPKLKNKYIDYLALGHVHGYSTDKLDDRGTYAYSGCLSPRGFDELGDKGFVLIETGENSLDTKFIKLNNIKFSEKTFFVDNFTNFYSFADEVVLKIKRDFFSKDVVKIIIEGEREPEFDIDVDYLNKKLSSIVFYSKITDLTKVKFNLEEIKNDKSIKGEFIRLVLESKLDEETKKDIIITGIKAFKGEK